MMTSGWNRRGLIGGAALVAVALGVPVGYNLLARLNPSDAPTDGQRALMRAVAEHVIPRTTTPGAGETGTGDFVLVALAHGLEGSRRPVDARTSPVALAAFLRDDGSLRHIDWLAHELDRRSGGNWLKRAPGDRATILAALDADAFGQGANAHPWRTIKGLILTGYYTSEIGASQELQYELTPGRFDPKIRLPPGARAWSSDWTAVDFG
jgi:Gluconate 2-dehydrogenase subunit 3